MSYLNKLRDLSYPNKYFTIYHSICQAAFARSKVHGERHHILPKSFGLGGEKDKANIVLLTHREHYIVHQLLVRFLRDTFYKKKMDYALWRITNRKIGYIPNSRQYATIRSALIQNIKNRIDSAETRAKKARPGKLNGMYNRTHSDEVKLAASKQAIEKFKGKSYVDLYGEEKALQLKAARSESTKKARQTRSGVGAKNPNSKTYRLTSPLGIEYLITGTLSQFCKEHRLPIGKVIDVAKGRLPLYKGWIAEYSIL